MLLRVTVIVLISTCIHGQGRQTGGLGGGGGCNPPEFWRWGGGVGYLSNHLILKEFFFNAIRSGWVLALKGPPLRFFALTHLILELHYCALGTFPKKQFNTVWRKFLIVGHDLAVRGSQNIMFT